MTYEAESYPKPCARLPTSCFLEGEKVRGLGTIGFRVKRLEGNSGGKLQCGYLYMKLMSGSDGEPVRYIRAMLGLYGGNYQLEIPWQP